MATDLSKPDDFTKWLEWVQTRTTKSFLRDGRLRPTAYLALTRDPDGKMLDSPIVAGIVPMRFDTEEGKNDFAHAIRTAAIMGRAVGYAFAAEAWAVEVRVADITTDMPREEREAKAAAVAEQYAGKVKTHEERKEILSIVSEHIAMPECRGPSRRAHILRSGKSVRVSTWSEAGRSGGAARFSGILEDAQKDPGWADYTKL